MTPINRITRTTSTQKPTPDPASSMTIREAIAYIHRHIPEEKIHGNAYIMRMMENVAELNETGILTSLDTPLTAKQISRLALLVKPINEDEPLEYITGSCEFHGRRLYVSKSTLIPRPETETLVDITLSFAHNALFSEEYLGKTASGKKRHLSIVDVGTGSGCIIIATALMLKEPVDLYATDISAQAITTARKNLKAYALENKIHLYTGSLLEPIPNEISFDIIVANLPYIKDDEMGILPDSIKNYEPHIALDGGENGASVIRELLIEATERLNPKGVILLEVQPAIIQAVKAYTKRFFPSARLSIMKDTFDVDRFIVVET